MQLNKLPLIRSGFLKKFLKRTVSSALTPHAALTPPSKKPARVVVHLGNVGLGLEGEVPAQKTAKLAQQFRNVQFIGIDKRRHTPTHPNWRQVRAGFIRGIKKLPNGSVDVLRSEMSIGYYGYYFLPRMIITTTSDAFRYAAKFFKLAKTKLKPTGKIVLVVDDERLHTIYSAAREAGFTDDKLSYKYLDKEQLTSFWMQKWKQKHPYDAMVEITLIN